MRKKKSGWQSKKLMTTKNCKEFALTPVGWSLCSICSDPFHLFVELLTIISFWIACHHSLSDAKIEEGEKLGIQWSKDVCALRGVQIPSEFPDRNCEQNVGQVSR